MLAFGLPTAGFRGGLLCRCKEAALQCSGDVMNLYAVRTGAQQNPTGPQLVVAIRDAHPQRDGTGIKLPLQEARMRLIKPRIEHAMNAAPGGICPVDEQLREIAVGREERPGLSGDTDLREAPALKPAGLAFCGPDKGPAGLGQGLSAGNDRQLVRGEATASQLPQSVLQRDGIAKDADRQAPAVSVRGHAHHRIIRDPIALVSGNVPHSSPANRNAETSHQRQSRPCVPRPLTDIPFREVGNLTGIADMNTVAAAHFDDTASA